MKDIDARTAYEFYLGKRTTDNHWYSVCRNLRNAGMEVNSDNVVFYAKLREAIPRSSLSILKVFELYKRAEKMLALNNSKVKGSEVLEILAKEGIRPHPSTITRWFKPLNGFRKSRDYYPEKLTPVLTSALIYKTIHSTKLEA